MLLPTMNSQEIYKEIIDDSVSVMKTVSVKMHYELLRMKRTNQFKWVETLHIKTARNNEWCAIINLQPGVKEINYYVKTYDKVGVVAYSLLMFEEIPTLIKYNAHFFKRYRERMHLKEVKLDQVLKHFFKHNVYITPAYSELQENEPTFAAISFPQGLGLGRFHAEMAITEMKTFIAHETLNNGQRELVQMLNEDEKYEGFSFTEHHKTKGNNQTIQEGENKVENLELISKTI